MRNILETYYKGFAQKQGFESVLADDFVFIMNDAEPLLGKMNYVEMCKDFCQSYRSMQPTRTIVENEEACVIVSYEWILPSGETQNGNVVEIWKAENGLLKELKIYFNQ